MSKIAVLVVGLNAKALLADLFTSLAQQTRPPDSMIFVDNGSTDQTVEYLAQEFPWVHVVALPANIGYTPANNLALEQTDAEFIALLNADTYVNPQFIAQLEQTLSADSGCGAAVAKIRLMSPDPIIDCVGAEFNNIGYCWGRGVGQPDRGQFDTPQEVAGITCCATMLRRAALAGKPLFDPKMFLYYDEFELTLRLRGRGWRIVSAPQAIAYHKGSYSSNAAKRRPELFRQYLANRNRLKVLCKYYPLSHLLRNLLPVVASLAYWNARFLVGSGPRLFVRSVVEQAQFAVTGLRERGQVRDVVPGRWLPWMQQQSMRQTLNAYRSFARIKR